MRTMQPRAHDRFRHLREILIRVEPCQSLALAHTVDLGRGGVKVFTRRPLAHGDLVELTWADRESPVAVEARVAHVRVEDDGYLAGVRFLQVLAPSTLRALRSRPEEMSARAARDAEQVSRTDRTRTA